MGKTLDASVAARTFSAPGGLPRPEFGGGEKRRRQRPRYRTLWLSDVHLGLRGCRAREAARFIKISRCETLYLVGDIIDMWRLRQRWYWPPEHNEVIRQILKQAKRCRVVFIPGNHDEAARQYQGLELGGVEVRPFDVHETADGRRLFVTHGDQYDLVVKHSPFLSFLGGMAYDWLIAVNHHYNVVRRRLGFRYRSLSRYVKLRVKGVSLYFSRFEESLIEEAVRRRCDGIVCGHVHQPEIREGEIAYYNCGDWVESCTALAEHQDGRIEIVDGLRTLAEWDAAKRRAVELETPQELPLAV